jgi:ADP-glucose pyrophosphorylase
MDVGNVAVYRQAQRDVIDGLVHSELPTGASRVGDCIVCAGAAVDGTIEDHTVVGHHAVIEAGATVRNSILWDGAIVKSGTTLENCIVGEGVSVSSSHTIFGGIIVEGNRP